VIARRKALHRVWRDNFVPLVASIFLKFPEVIGFGNPDLIVMECQSHTDLENVVAYLLSKGLSMTSDGAFDDFAIVHGTHGFSMRCRWLDYKTDADGATIRFKTGADPLDLSLAETGYEGPGWITARGHGFMISQRDDFDVWVDFNTGGTIVSLRHPVFSPTSSRHP
jgi:hypothetical protein